MHPVCILLHYKYRPNQIDRVFVVVCRWWLKQVIGYCVIFINIVHVLWSIIMTVMCDLSMRALLHRYYRVSARIEQELTKHRAHQCCLAASMQRIRHAAELIVRHTGALGYAMDRCCCNNGLAPNRRARLLLCNNQFNGMCGGAVVTDRWGGHW